MQVEGLMSSSKEEPEDRRISEANTAGFRELFAWEEEEKSEEGLPGG
jgi:hypothetical protein